MYIQHTRNRVLVLWSEQSDHLIILARTRELNAVWPISSSVMDEWCVIETKAGQASTDELVLLLEGDVVSGFSLVKTLYESIDWTMLWSIEGRQQVKPSPFVPFSLHNNPIGQCVIRIIIVVYWFHLSWKLLDLLTQNTDQWWGKLFVTHFAIHVTGIDRFVLEWEIIFWSRTVIINSAIILSSFSFHCLGNEHSPSSLTVVELLQGSL